MVRIDFQKLDVDLRRLEQCRWKCADIEGGHGPKRNKYLQRRKYMRLLQKRASLEVAIEEQLGAIQWEDPDKLWQMRSILDQVGVYNEDKDAAQELSLEARWRLLGGTILFSEK